MGKKAVRYRDRYAKREAEKYENPIPSREYILDYLAKHGKPTTYQHLIREFDLIEDEKEALRRRLIAMCRDGQLHQNRRGAYGLIDKMELIAGRVLGHREGYGFIVPDEGGEDLFLGPRQMRSVFPDDKVLAKVINIDNRGRREAIVVEVIERHTHTLVGRLRIESGSAVVEPSNHKISQEILIASTDLLDAKNGQMVLVEITTQPTIKTRPAGKVISILGDHMAPGMEIDVAIYNHEIPEVWPEDVLAEAKQFSPTVTEKSFAGHQDFRHLPFVTIDGEDAKDFDDAVCCVERKGGFTLYVAIADVSHYVKPNTALDREAYLRGNSVYFPAKVIPMLPEALSNELCSLKPKVNRLTIVCEMSISPAGKIMQSRFHKGIIFSQARLTYNQVYAAITNPDSQVSPDIKTLLPHLQKLFSVYQVLHRARVKRGSIDFDLPETKIIFGSGRKIEKIIPATRNDAHRVIEECMLAANICAAQFLIKNKRPLLFRVHEGPSTEKLMDLRQFLRESNLSFPKRALPTSKDYADLLKNVLSRPDAHLIQTVLLRSLSQAVYTPVNKGHFGLAYDTYTHFTSPIRRYPDLLIHRAITDVLSGKKLSRQKDNLLEKQGEHCSMTERRADEATREVIDWLKCEFMLSKVGHEFPGIISGVTGFGLFVELSDIYVEGLLHISALKNDYYHFDAIKHCLLGERSGKRYRLGDKITVRVAKVDLDDRKIDLALPGEIEATRPPKKSKKYW